MGHGRKTRAPVAGVADGFGDLEIQRPDAPYDLTDEQSQEWWAVVNRMPADWLPRETRGMLAQYCRHVVRARRVAQMLDAMERADDFDVKEYRELLKAEAEESRAIASLATRMRLSQQSTYDRKKSKPVTMRRPWEDRD
jgi:hypothetical protein